MKKGFWAIMFFVFLLLYSTPIITDAEVISGKEKVLITFDQAIDQKLLKEAGVEPKKRFTNIPTVAAFITADQRQFLESKPQVKWVEKEQFVQVQATQTVTAQYKRVQAHTAKKAGWTGKNIKVAVVDTGINGKHPDLKLAGGISFVKQSPYDVDEFGHGTHVAGIIAAQDNNFGVLGIAPDAKIYSVKALGKNGFGTETAIISSVDWAINNKMDLINLSLTSPTGTKAMEEILKKAEEKGILTVAAAGNMEDLNEKFSDVLYPARYPSVIAVCSLENNLERSLFSYYGPSLEVCAPGSNVYSTYSDPKSGTDEDYGTGSGTSVAAPFVTGALALYKEAYPDKTGKQIRKIMEMNALPLGKGERNSDFGFGLVQAPGEVLSSFTDIRPDAWYTGAVRYLSQSAIITGYPDSTFKPDGDVTRAEAATIIGKALDLKGEGSTGFTDIPKGHFAEKYIKAAVEQGIITGYPDGSFRPNALINRGEVAVMIQRAFHYDSTQDAGFKDIKKEAYYAAAVNALKGAKITNGYPEDNTYRPGKRISRAEYSLFIARALSDKFIEN